MGDISVAAYDPVFWAHHTMIDRVWALWQLRHPGAGPPASLLGQALAPFPMTVKDTLEIAQLGYDYAVGTTAAQGPGHHG
jgi:tyrosinase